MQSFIRRQISSFITPESNASFSKKKSSVQANQKQQQIGKSLTVHQFDPAVNLIFRPKRFVHLNKSTRPNPLTDRNPPYQEQQHKQQEKSSSLQKSLSLLKRFKDFVVPQKFTFPIFSNSKTQNQAQAKDENLNLSINSKKNNHKQNKSNFSNEDQRGNQPKQDIVAMKKISGLSNSSNVSVYFDIPQLKISLPRSSNKSNGSNNVRPPIIIQDDYISEANIQSSRKNSLINSIMSSKNSQISQKPKLSQSSSPSKITNPTFNLLKTQHIECQKLKYFYILGHSLTQFSTTIYVLIGNENQIDCLCISKMSKQEIVDIELDWSLSLQKGNQQKGKIASIAFDALKSSYITLLSNDMKIIEIYRYNTKQLGKAPTFLTYINILSPIHTMCMIKQSQIILFYQSKLVEIYSIEQQNQVKKKYQKALETKIEIKKNSFNDLNILCIGEPFMNSITVYLACEESETGNSHFFDLYIIEVSFQGHGETTMAKPHRVYSIKKDLKQLLKFDNFSKRFFLLYVGLQVIAVMKEGYMIDSAKVDIQQQKSMLKYMGKNRLLLITQSKIEQYEFNLNENSPPYRLHIKSLDSIILPENYDPKAYEFLDALPIFQLNNTQKSLYQPSQFFTFYLFCFQLKHQKNKKVLTGQVPYLLTMTKTVSVKQKADKLFHFQGRNIQTVDLKEIQEKVDIAKKMGLKVKEIYLDLWNRTKKNTVKDFCFLLDTLDYEIISKEIEKKLKKQAMLYTELSKIQSSCFYLLKKKVFSPECTEMDIKHFIVSHFRLKKYYFFKDVSRFCENQQVARDQLKLPDKQLSSESSLKSPQTFSVTESQREKNDKEQKKLMFDIQAFYTYNQMELKSQLLQLFQKYFYEISESPSFISISKQTGMLKSGGKIPLVWAKKMDYLLKIKIMMNNFRFQLKIIYEQLLQELIRMTEKGEMIIELLNDFEQILPRSFSGEKVNSSQELVNSDNNEEQQIRMTKRQEISRLKRSLSKSTHGQLQLEGIWRQVPETQFQNYLYLQSIETIYNRPLIQTLSEDIWFKRNLYSQHDLILKTKQQILQIDRKLKSSYIFYFFIDKVYQYIGDQTLRREVIQLIDRNYSNVLPKHLKGKIQLYYQLYLETKRLSKEYVATLHKQIKNPINQNAGLRTSTINLEGQSALNFFLNLNESNKLNSQKSNQYKKSLYQTFLPPKHTEKEHHLDSFQNFLKLSEIQLFGQFVKLQYILVGCIFHRIKPVYEKFWKGREIFNQTVQKYFESKNSQLSHLKCLLNRLNSETKEFQAEHFDLYEVLVKSVMVKVYIGSLIPQKEYINVDELIIYIRDICMVNDSKGLRKIGMRRFGNIFQKEDQSQNCSNSKISQAEIHKQSPILTDQNPFLSNPPKQSKIQTFLNILGCVSKNKDLFRNLKTRTSLYEIYQLHRNNRTETITTLIVEYFIENYKLYQLQSYESFEDKTIDILVQSAMILSKIYSIPQNFIKNQMDFQSEEEKDTENQNFQSELFFILLWKIMSYQNYLYNGWIFRLLKNKDIINNYRVNEILKENLVIFMSKYRFSIDKLFVNNIKYFECLIQVLPESNRIRKYFASQIEFVKSIEPIYDLGKRETKFQCKKVTPKITNPLTENSQIISIFHLQQIFSLYPSEYLLKLDLERICEIVNDMQKILLEVAVKQRFADHNEPINGDASLIQSVDDREGEFRRIERENSRKFILSMKKSLDLIEDQNRLFSVINTPICAPELEISRAIENNKEITLFELQTLIRQSARPHAFSKESESQLVKSSKQISQSAIQSLIKQQSSKSRQQKQIQEQPMSQLQNLSQYCTSLTEIYEIVVKRLINSEMIKQVLQHLQKLLKLSQTKEQQSSQFYIVYPLMILNIISRELTPENKLLLVKICSHLFKEPLELLKFIKELIGKKDKPKIDFTQLQSSAIFYSLGDLNKKLVDYQQITRIYKPQYPFQQNEPQSALQNTLIETPIQPKHKLKKKLIIEIEDEQQKLPQKVNSKKTAKMPQYIKRPFSYENPIIAAHCINSINSQSQKLKFIQHIWTLFETLHREKELFSKDFEFMIMNVMLFQEPYSIVKYMEIKLKGWYFAGREQQLSTQAIIHTLSSNSMIKFKNLMSYFNQMIKQQSINPLRLLEFGKRMFYMLYSTIVERSSIEYQINQYYEIPLTQILPCDEFPESPISQIYAIKFKQSIQAFSKKQKQIKRKMTQSGKFIPEIIEQAPQMNKKSPQFKLFIKKVSTLQQLSPNKFSQFSKQDLLQISYNNIEDSLSQNLQTPLITQNPSKISDFSRTEEGFDLSKQRQLVYSRGQKRLAAMLSNNSSIVLKNKISPRSTRSPMGPSMGFFSSENSKIKKGKQKFLSQNHQLNKFDLKKKKTFDSGAECRLNSDGEIAYHQEESVIFQQDFQNSRNPSEIDVNENFCIEPPKLINKQTDNLFKSSSLQESKVIQVKSTPNTANHNKNHIETSIQMTKQITNEQNEEKKQLIARKSIIKKKSSSINNPHQGSIKEAIVIMEEDHLNKFEPKFSTGCQFDPNLNKTQKGNKSIEKNAPFKRTSDRKMKTINHTSQSSNNQKIKQSNFSPSKNIQKKQKESHQFSPHRKSALKKDQNKTKSPTKDLSNEVRKFSKSIQQQKIQQINEFIITQSRKEVNTDTKKQSKQTLTGQILNKDVILSKIQDHKLLSQTQSEKIPKIIISPRNRSEKNIKPAKSFVRQNSANENYLLIKIKQILSKNNIQMFLLTELEDIYEKFKYYWEKCEDIIPGSAKRGYQNENELGDQNSGRSSIKSKNIRNGQTSSPKPKISKVKNNVLEISQDLSFQLSRSHQSFVHEQQQIQLLSNLEAGNYGSQQEVLFTKQQLYELIMAYLTEKVAQTQSQQQELPESEILLQELKDKLFYDICMKRLLQNFTNQSNIHTIAKIIDKVFAKKILLTDYYYEVISKKEVQKLQSIVEKVAQQATLRTFRYISPEQNQSSTQIHNQNSLQMQNKNSQKHTKMPSIIKMSNFPQKNLSPRATSAAKNSFPRFDNDQDQLQRLLQAQMAKLENLLQKIPLNILQYRKKQLMLKLKPGKQLGRKYLLDVLVKVFEKKKDKKLAQEIHLRLKNIIDKDIKM